MANIGKVADLSAIQVRAYAERLLRDIPSAIFASKPRIGGNNIDTNHPAFIVGHLSLYPYRISGILNLGLEEFKPSERYYSLFLIGTECKDDPDGKIYPPKDELLDFYFRGTEKVNAIVKELSDEVLMAQNRDEKSKDRFPIVGGFINYLLAAHPNIHLGQVSVWRRCMGLGPAK